MRALTRADLPEVAAIEAALPDGWDLARLAGQLDGACGWQFVATAGNAPEIVGYVCGVAVEGEAEIYRLVVRADCRGRGCGTALLQRALERLVGTGVCRVFLEVRASNRPALALYARGGFKEIGRRRAYYAAPAEDAIIMARNDEKEIHCEEHQGH